MVEKEQFLVPPSEFSVLSVLIKDRATLIAFVVNQLYPGSIGISPLTTTHPRILPHSPVLPIKHGDGWFTWFRV